MATPYTPKSSAKLPLYDTPQPGCAWLTAPRASMAHSIAAASSSNGATAPVKSQRQRKRSRAAARKRPALGAAELIGRPAVLDLPEGKGHVVAFNFNPFHRDMNRGDQRLVWNAMLNWQKILTQQNTSSMTREDTE